MMLTISIEASQSCGRYFRLALGISIPAALIAAVISLTGLS